MADTDNATQSPTPQVQTETPAPALPETPDPADLRPPPKINIRLRRQCPVEPPTNVTNVVDESLTSDELHARVTIEIWSRNEKIYSAPPRKFDHPYGARQDMKQVSYEEFRDWLKGVVKTAQTIYYEWCGKAPVVPTPEVKPPAGAAPQDQYSLSAITKNPPNMSAAVPPVVPEALPK